ncbi:MAG: hypothetical protein ACYDH4_09930 [Candidatus Cryosericum sp.]
MPADKTVREFVEEVPNTSAFVTITRFDSYEENDARRKALPPTFSIDIQKGGGRQQEQMRAILEAAAKAFFRATGEA